MTQPAAKRQSATVTDGERRFRFYNTAPLVAAVLILVLGIGLSVFAVHSTQRRLDAADRYHFSLQFDRLEASVSEQFQRPMTGMQALAGLLQSDAGFAERNLRTWVGSQDMARQYQGVLGFGLMQRAGSWRNVFFEPLRAAPPALPANAGEFLDAVMHTGEAALWPMREASGNAGRPSEYLYLLPVYRSLPDFPTPAQRQQALSGILFARIELNELLLPSLGLAERWTDFDLTDRSRGGLPTLVYSSVTKLTSGGPAAVSAMSRRHYSNHRALVIGGRVLELEAGSTTGFDVQRDHDTPTLVGVAGGLLSVLLAVIFWQLMAARVRAQKLATRMTSDLRRLAHVVQRTSHLVFMGDESQNLVWVNQAFSQFTGVSADAAAGRELSSVLDLDRSELTGLDALRKALRYQQALRAQIPIVSRLGQQGWFDIDLQHEFDTDGQYSGFIVIAADITSQQEAAEKVAHAMQENQALLNAINQHSIVSITDPAGRILFVNDTFTSISGFSREELIGANHRILQSHQQPTEYWSAMWKTISAGYSWRDTICNRARDGSLYWVDSVITPLMDASGQIEKYISIRTDVSPARRAQEQINTERQQLQAILEGTNAGTWEWDVSSDEYRINGRWAAMLGYNRGELGTINAERWASLCHPDDQAAAHLALEKHLRGEAEFIEREFRMRHRDGHWIWIQSRGKVSYWSSPGQPGRVSGIHLDISAQKRMQAELRQNNQLMQSILANIPVALSVFDGDLRLIAKNDRFAELLDFPPELIDREHVQFEDLIQFNAARGEYGSENIDASVQRIIASARHPVVHQFERSRPNGVSLEVRGAPMPGGGLITTYADITPRKQAEAEMQRSTRMLQSVLDSASEVAVIAINLQHQITLFNKGAERLLGYSAAQAMNGMRPEVFFEPAELEARSSAMSAQLNRQVLGLQSVIDDSVFGKRGEWTHIHRDGHRFAAALVVTALTDWNGERVGYLLVSHDITQEKEHETRLQIAMEEAEQASTAKGQFLANMSHEIRTPMNAILGMLRLLQNTALDHRQQDYASKTESAARSLLGLLNDLLDFSKAEAGKMQLDLQPFRLDTILRDLSVILSATVGHKDIEVLFDVDPQIPDGLVGDAMRLQQILVNLTGNAIKFTEQGEVVLSVQLRARSTDSVSLHFAIRDSGIGIDPKHQRHIFSGFSQAEASTTRRFGGTGLGLSICRHLVTLMGGDLALDSSPGLGSTFYFTLTLPTSPAQPPAVGAGNVAPKHVLLVEDNPLACACIADMAHGLGWSVEACSSADAALSTTRQRADSGLPAFELLLIDWNVGGTEPAALVHQLLSQQAGPPALAIALVTAQGREALAQIGATDAARLDGFVVKPLTASMLDEALLHARAQRQNPRPHPGTQVRRQQRLAGLRLLVVEDNLINQQVARELLSAEGALIDLAGNGQLGVDAVANASVPYDAVLMDIQMPVMDGYTASVTIRHELGQHQLPIIAMTANAMATDREACLAAGMNDHIGKPFDLPQLISLLCRHTGHQPDLQAVAVEPVAEATIPEPAAPAPAEGIAWESALAMLGGNMALYAQICEAYLKEISGLMANLQTHLESQQSGEVVRLLHTYKGLSLTVGANRFSALCSKLEKEAKALPEASPSALSDWSGPALQAIGPEVAATIQAISTLLRQWSPTEPAPVATPDAPNNAAIQVSDAERAALIEDLQALIQLLTHSDLHSIEVHSSMCRRHKFALRQLQAIHDNMLTFEFPKAVVQCEALMREFALQK